MFNKTNNKIVKNSAWFMMQQAYDIVLSFFIGILSARYLGTDNFGLLGLATSIYIIFSSVSWLGIDSIIVNELIVSDDSKGKLIGTSIFFKFLASFLCFVLSIIFVKIIYNDDISVLVMIIYGSSMLFQISDIFQYWFQSKQSFFQPFLSIVISKTIIVIYQIYLILNKKNIVWFSSVNLIYSIILFFLLTYFFYKFSDINLSIDCNYFIPILKNSSHFIISSLAVALYIQFDRIMISKILTNSDVGVYNVAANLATVWQFVPLAIINAFRPYLLERKKTGFEEFKIVYRKLIRIIALVSFAFCIMIFVFAPLMVALYGRDYSEAVTPLRICTWATAVSMFGVIRSVWLVAFNYNRYDKYYKIFAVFLNILLNYILIRKIGISGAAVATLISYFFEVFIATLIFKNTRNYVPFVFKSIFMTRNS